VHEWKEKRSGVGLKSTTGAVSGGPRIKWSMSGAQSVIPLSKDGAESRGQRNRLERWTETLLPGARSCSIHMLWPQLLRVQELFMFLNHQNMPVYCEYMEESAELCCWYE